MALTKAHNRIIEGAQVNVKDFGALGDNVTDDSDAIQAAIDHARTFNQRAVFCPRGFYRISKTINVSGVSIIGDGVYATRFIQLPSFTGTELFLLDQDTTGGAAGLKYSMFQLQGYRTGSPNVVSGIRLRGDVLHNVFENLKISELKAFGVVIEGDDPTTTTTRPSVNTFINLRIIGNDKAALMIKAGRSNTFIDCTFEQHNEQGIRIEGQNVSESPNRISFINGWVENVGDGYDAINISQANHILFQNTTVLVYGDATGTSGNGFTITNSNYCTIDNVSVSKNRSGASTATSKMYKSDVGRYLRIINPPANFDYSSDYSEGSTYPIVFDSYDNQNIGPTQSVVVSNSTSLSGGSDVYIQPHTNISKPTLAEITTIAQNRMVVKSVHARTKQLPGAGEQYNGYLYVNGVNKALVALTDANSGENIVTTPVVIEEGDEYGFRILCGASAATLSEGELQITATIWS